MLGVSVDVRRERGQGRVDVGEVLSRRGDFWERVRAVGGGMLLGGERREGIGGL